MNRRTLRLVVTTTLVAVVGLNACTTSKADKNGTDDGKGTTASVDTRTVAAGPTTGLTADTIKIAVLWPDFGSLVATGLVPDLGPIEQEVTGYVNYLNKNGGIAGRQIIATFHDFDPSDLSGASARAACLEATEEDKAFAVIGMPSWPQTGTLCVAEEHETPMIATTSLTPSVSKRTNGRAFSMAMDLVRMSQGWVQVLDDRGALKAKRIGLVVGDGDIGIKEAATDGIEAELKARGYEVIETVVLPCSTQFCEQHENAVEKLRSANVNLVFDLLGAVSSPTFISAANAAGFKPQYTFSSSLLSSTVAKFHESVAPSLDGMIGVGEFGPNRPGDKPLAPSEFSVKCNDIYEKAFGSRLTADAAGMANQGCAMLEVLKRGAEGVPKLGQESLVAGIEGIGELVLGPPAPSYCDTPEGSIYSFGPGKHDAGDWVTSLAFDGATSQFYREEPCQWIEIDS